MRFPGYPIFPPKRVPDAPVVMPVVINPNQYRVANPGDVTTISGEFSAPPPFTGGFRQSFVPRFGDGAFSPTGSSRLRVLNPLVTDFNCLEFDLQVGQTPNGFCVPWALNLWTGFSEFTPAFAIGVDRSPMFMSHAPQRDLRTPTVTDPANSTTAPDGNTCMGFYGHNFRNVFLEAIFGGVTASYPGDLNLGIVTGRIRCWYDPRITTFSRTPF